MFYFLYTLISLIFIVFLIYLDKIIINYEYNLQERKVKIREDIENKGVSNE